MDKVTLKPLLFTTKMLGGVKFHTYFIDNLLILLSLPKYFTKIE